MTTAENDMEFGNIDLTNGNVDPFEQNESLLNSFTQTHVTQYKSDPGFVVGVGRQILSFQTPSGSDNSLKSKIDHWLTNSSASPEALSVGTDFKIFVASGMLPEKNTIDASGVGVPRSLAGEADKTIAEGPEAEPKRGPEALAQGGAQLAGALANTIGAGGRAVMDGLARLAKPIGDAVAHRNTVNAQAKVEKNTNANIASMNSMKDISEKDGGELRRQLDAFKALTPEQQVVQKEAFTNDFVKKFSETSEKIKASASSQARLNADPSIDSKFKRSERDITDDTDEVTTKMSRLADEAQGLLGTDTENVNKVKAAQKMLEELFENIKKMVKAIFSGFGAKGPSKAPAPRPS